MAQVLSTRKRKDADMDSIVVRVCVFAFDILFLNGESLLHVSFSLPFLLFRFCRRSHHTKRHVLFHIPGYLLHKPPWQSGWPQTLKCYSLWYFHSYVLVLIAYESCVMQRPFAERRELLYKSFNVIPNEFQFAKASDASDVEAIQEFLNESIAGNCEGLMVKTLDVDAT